MKLIFGLGNPGKKFMQTRHNVGFMAVDAFARDIGGVWKKNARLKSEVLKTEIDGETVILAKPATYMNLSGEAAKALLSFYKIAPKNVLIVHDDMDLISGKFQFRGKGGGAGHKGVASIHESLGTADIPRLRIGIGRPEPDSKIEVEDWVLGHLSPEYAPNPLDTASALRDWIEGGTEKAASKWN